MKDHKITLWVIITLLIIMLPMSIYGTYMHFITTDNKDEENPTHEFKLNNKLYFYDNDDNLVGTYNCVSDDCDMATNSVSDTYSLKELESEEEFSLIDNRYVFLTDDSEDILLYDLDLEKTIGTYKSVKNYGVGINNNAYILENKSGKYGVVTFNDGLNVKLTFNYDYIGCTNKLNDNGEVACNRYAVYSDGDWFLTDENNSTYTDSISNEIVDYTDKYIVIKDNDSNTKVIDYSNKSYLSTFRDITLYDTYALVLDSFSDFSLYDIATNTKLSSEYNVGSLDEVSLNVSDDTLEIIIDDEVEETIAID